MSGKRVNLFNRRSNLFILITTALMIFLFAGYAAAATVFGKLDRDRDLDNMFRSYEVMHE